MISASLQWARRGLKSLGRNLITGIAGVGALKVLASLLGLATNLLLARWLAPQGMGQYAFALSAATLLSLPLLQGMPLLLVREVAGAAPGRRRGLARALLLFSAVATGLVAALSALVWLAWRVLGGGEAVDDSLWWFALAVPVLMAAGLAWSAVTRAEGRAVRGHLPDMLARPGLLLLGLGGLWWAGAGIDPRSAMAVHALAALLALGLAIALAPRLRGAAPEPAQPRAWLAALLPLSTVAGIQLVNSQVELVVLGLNRPADEVGVYRIASLLALQTSFLLTVVNAVAAPLFVAHHRAGRLADLRRLQRLTALLSLGFGALIGLAYLLVGQPALAWGLGPAYAAAWAPLMLLTAAHVGTLWAGSTNMLLNMIGRERDVLQAALVSVLVNVGLSLLLVPRWGMMGAASAAALALFAWRVSLTFFLHRAMSDLALAVGDAPEGKP